MAFLTQRNFSDAIALRYGWPPQRVLEQCTCDQQFSVHHALICLRLADLCPPSVDVEGSSYIGTIKSATGQQTHYAKCGLCGAAVSVVTFKAKGRRFKCSHGCSHIVQKPSISPRLFGQCTLNILTIYHLLTKLPGMSLLSSCCNP